MLAVILDNPIFMRELRRRMRGRAMILSLIAYIGIVCAVSFLILLFSGMALDPSEGQNFVDAIAGVGRAMFFSVLAAQALLVLVVAPSITAGMITAEREKRTFDFLRVTTIRPSTFVLGGLMSTMMFILLVQVCALPVLCVPFLYGGMSPGELLGWSGTLFGAALTLASMGLYLSSVRTKTRTAQGAMGAVTLLLFFFLFQALGLYVVRGGTGGLTSPLWMTYGLFGGAINAPGWSVTLVLGVALSALMVLIAGRKLYDPETRALTYWQFLIVVALVAGGFLAARWGKPDVETLIAWLWLGNVGLLVAVMTYCARRMRVGGGLWRLKQRFRWLRGRDDALVFVLILCALWWFVSLAFFGSGPANAASAGAAKISEPVFVASLLVALSPMVYLAIAARLLTIWLPSRRQVIGILLTAVVGLWLIAPLGLMVASHFAPDAEMWLMGLARVSPFYAASELIDAAPAAPVVWTDWLSLPGSGATAVYALLAVGFAIAYVPAYRRYAREAYSYLDGVKASQE